MTPEDGKRIADALTSIADNFDFLQVIFVLYIVLMFFGSAFNERDKK